MKNTESVIIIPSANSSVFPEYTVCMLYPNTLPPTSKSTLIPNASSIALTSILRCCLCPRRYKIPVIVATMREASITSRKVIKNAGNMSVKRIDNNVSQKYVFESGDEK